MKTQNERLIEAMKHGQRINPLIAWRELGIYRLASRICDLRKDGHPIKSDWFKTHNKYGERVKVKEYYI